MPLRKSTLPIIGFTLAVVLQIMPAYAEAVKPLNPDCDVCPIVISFPGNETKAMLGQEAVALLRKTIAVGHRETKLDMDGMLKPGSEADSNTSTATSRPQL